MLNLVQTSCAAESENCRPHRKPEGAYRPEMEGVRAMPMEGRRAPAARGIPTRLYPKAHHRFCRIFWKVAWLNWMASSTCGSCKTQCSIAAMMGTVPGACNPFRTTAAAVQCSELKQWLERHSASFWRGVCTQLGCAKRHNSLAQSITCLLLGGVSDKGMKA